MKCPICSGRMENLFGYPELPVSSVESADLRFMFCNLCSHGMLDRVVDAPGELVSGKSHSATKCLEVFAEWVRHWCAGANTIIDIGGNDSTLLQMFIGDTKVCIDPMVGESIEEADLTRYRFPQKLILSSHTIEHLGDPTILVSKVAEVMREKDYLALQFPSLDLLVQDCRLDQVHHQHIHYFSERSISALLAPYGLKIIASHFNHDHWGTLMVVCKKGAGGIQGKQITWLDILNARITFSLEMMACDMRLKKKPFVAYGYGPMFRVLGYHLPSLKEAEYIVDDDPTKGKTGSLAEKDVFISAFSSKMTARQLMAKAFERGARNVMVPLQTL